MPNDFPFYRAGYVFMRSESEHTIQSFISKLSNTTGSSDGWFVLPASFDNPSLSRWDCSGRNWELIAFNVLNSGPDDRRFGCYTNLANVTTYITFYSFDSVDIKRVYPTS
ncbi:hypothetical protein L218DRAFT_957535 [Marasmius fiardii PR-910]|nr:hypothetical protein L218DRAFT_957535 [Marasmius fiardii PR-910]